MIQYIACDLDGTMFPEGTQVLDPEIPDLIRKLKEKGILFIASSGRQYANMRRLFTPVREEISYVTENGSYCVDQGEVVARGVIDRELGVEIFQSRSGYTPGCGCELSCESTCYVDSKDPRFLDFMENEIRYDMKIVPDLTEIREPFLKIAMCDFNGTDAMMDYFKPLFSDRIKVVTAGKIWVDFIAPNANKGTGLLSVLNHQDLDPQNGIAIGDQYNDIEMLDLAGVSLVMKNHAPGVEQHADYVIDAVKPVLQKLLIGDTPN